MNAPEKSIATVEAALDASSSMLTVPDIKRATGLDEASVRAQLKALAQQGQIDHIPGRGRYDGRHGLLRPIAPAAPSIAEVAPSIAEPAGEQIDAQDNADGALPVGDMTAQFNGFDVAKLPPILISCVAKLWPGSEGMFWERAIERMPERIAEAVAGLAAAVSQRDAWRDMAAPHGCETPSALAELITDLRAERDDARTELLETTKDIDEVREALAPFSAQIDPSDMTEIALAKRVAADLMNARALLTKLEHLLAVERQTSAALREQLDGMVSPEICSIAPAGYLVRAPKRRPRILTKPESAQAAAMAAARNGSGRGDVFALVPVGVAKRGAVWSPAK